MLFFTHFVREMGQNNNILPLVVHKLKEKQVRFGRSAEQEALFLFLPCPHHTVLWAKHVRYGGVCLQ